MSTHAQLCNVLGVEHSTPRPDWLPYAVQYTRIECHVGARRIVMGGAMACGQCGFHLSVIPGPGSGTQYTEPEALERCPKCAYRGNRFTRR